MRVFIGIPIPEPIRKRFQGLWADAPGKPTGFRPTAPENWHCTLAFLGEVGEEKIDALEHLLQTASERPPGGSFSFTNFETFPPKKPGYLIVRAIPEQKDAWMSYIDRMRDMASVISPTIDRKPWVPHVSIGRARKGILLPRWDHAFEPIVWKPTEISLVKSDLTTNGSVYKDLRVFPLVSAE